MLNQDPIGGIPISKLRKMVINGVHFIDMQSSDTGWGDTPHDAESITIPMVKHMYGTDSVTSG